MKEKKVTNLELNICKLRDVLDSRDLDTIYKNLNLFRSVEYDTKRQLNKYVSSPSHELSFTYEDVKALSDEAFNFIKNYQQKFLFDKYQKELLKHIPIDDVILKTFSLDIAKKMTVDTVLRAFYMEMGYMATIIWLWSQSSDKKTIDVMLLDTLRGFLQ